MEKRKKKLFQLKITMNVDYLFAVRCEELNQVYAYLIPRINVKWYALIACEKFFLETRSHKQGTRRTSENVAYCFTPVGWAECVEFYKVTIYQSENRLRVDHNPPISSTLSFRAALCTSILLLYSIVVNVFCIHEC